MLKKCISIKILKSLMALNVIAHVNNTLMASKKAPCNRRDCFNFSTHLSAPSHIHTALRRLKLRAQLSASLKRISKYKKITLCSGMKTAVPVVLLGFYLRTKSYNLMQSTAQDKTSAFKPEKPFDSARAAVEETQSNIECARALHGCDSELIALGPHEKSELRRATDARDAEGIITAKTSQSAPIGSFLGAKELEIDGENKEHEEHASFMHSAAKESGEIAASLKAQEADALLKNKLRQAQFMLAAQNRDRQGIASLIDAEGLDINLADERGCSALMYAAASGDHALVTLLVEKGADIRCKNRRGQTALIYAAANGHDKIVTLLKGKRRRSSSQR